ncbi:hypothetical protein Cs7R123_39590 [Catellatospora sp. TT07R-123]|uniref:hypothetical protein n=1 Tax=Catellatospora sp. TT07R-123 TaxID=2733863 RepID=UPI001B212294|nr:hypothetical protein [Catellatospora sp. TT07R-123]GHJ46617.1 hypothetical protein Cs7R123_39590 [Catellatospora sp. TT07R-123]
MSEPRIEETFAEFEAAAAGTFRPAGLGLVDDAVRRRRRTRRGGLGALALLAVSAPLLLAGMYGGGGEAPVLQPTPTVSSGAVAPVRATRPVRVPGFETQAPPTVVFTDADHGWTLVERCTGSDPCAMAVGVTGDGGRTWRRAQTPDLTGKVVNLYPLDGQTLTLHLIGEKYLLTTDGGAHFSSYPLNQPPPQAQLAQSRRDGREGYAVRCPGATGFEDGGAGLNCAKMELVRLGSGPVPVQPELGGPMTGAATVHRGGDGRLWVISQVAPSGRIRVQVSVDAARSWQQLPEIYSTGLGSLPDLVISPDGHDVWVACADGLAYHLDYDQWRRFDLNLDGQQPHMVRSLGEQGGLVLSDTRRTWYLTEHGVISEVPGLPGFDGIEQSADGTLFGYGDGLWLSPGAGPVREWIRLY